MYPHERSLVDQLKKDKFTLLGINSDSTPGIARAALAREKITWPVIFDGQDGPIARKWNVQGWPTIYVIDAKGVIRFKDVRDAALTKAVKDLLAEAKKK